MAYFQQTGPTTFRPTEHVGGAWDRAQQHVAPAMGLLLHAVEQDRDARRHDGLVPARLSYDIWGTVPLAEVGVEVAVVRAGRTIELVGARLTQAGRTVLTLRAWLLRTGDATTVAGTELARVPGPDEVPPWDPTTVWPGGFIASIELRRELDHPGQGRFWVRTPLPLLDEPVSETARAIGLLDIANGMTVRARPGDVFFANVDLTAHLFRPPGPGWLGLDSTVSFGPGGAGLTRSVLHDEAGPLGSLAQVLTVRLPQ